MWSAANIYHQLRHLKPWSKNDFFQIVQNLENKLAAGKLDTENKSYFILLSIKQIHLKVSNLQLHHHNLLLSIMLTNMLIAERKWTLKKNFILWTVPKAEPVAVNRVACKKVVITLCTVARGRWLGCSWWCSQQFSAPLSCVWKLLSCALSAAPLHLRSPLH